MSILKKIQIKLSNLYDLLVYRLRGQHKEIALLTARVDSVTTQKKADLVEVALTFKLIAENPSDYFRQRLVKVYERLQNKRRMI